MKSKLLLLIGLIFLCLSPFVAFSQTPITELFATYEAGPDTSYIGVNVLNNQSVTFNFGVPTNGTNDLRLDSLLVNVGQGDQIFRPVGVADRVSFFRDPIGTPISTNRQIIFFEGAHPAANPQTIRSSYVNTMEEALLGPIINRGSDNIFGQVTTDAGQNVNNIQRVDLIFENGLVVPPNPQDEGFLILERGGNDAFRIAAITGLNNNSDPVDYNPIVSVPANGWSSSTKYSFTTVVMRSDTPALDLGRSATVSTQRIAGIFVSFADLGLNAGDILFGYSLAGGDASTDPADWPTAANFPTNTSGNSSATGGLDLISGGSTSSRNPFDGSYTLTGDECWRMLSSPVAQTYGSLLNGLWTQGVPGSNAPGAPAQPNVLIWNTNTSAWVTPTSMQTSIPVGTGVLVSVFSDDNFDGNPEGFPKTINIGGTSNSGDISPVINQTVFPL